MSLTLAAHRMLSTKTDVKALLGAGNGFPTWIFREQPAFPIENTGKVALCLVQRGSWTHPNLHNTAKFPRLEVEIYADPDRGLQPSVAPVNMTGADKAIAVYEVFDRHLHLMNGGVFWDTLRIVDSKRANEPFPGPVPQADGLVYASVQYDVTLG